MSRLQEAKDLLAAGCGLDYLQNLEYHGVLGTVPGCKGPNHGWAMPPGISIKDAVWGTINVEQAKWKPALTEFATLRELLDAMVAEVELRRTLTADLDKLLACYRLGKNPGALLDRIDKTRDTLRGAL